MEKPPTLSQRQWVGVQRFLEKIAGWYPNVYPGQERLARQMGVSVRAIQRYVRWAQEAGLLTVIPDAGVGATSRTNVYHITELLDHDDKLAGTLTTDCRPIPTVTYVTAVQVREPPVQKPAASDPSVRLGGDAAAQTTMTPVDKSRAEEIAAAAGDRRATKRPLARDPDPSRRLTNHFLQEWENKVAMEIPRLRNIRPAESISATNGYIRSTFLHPKAGRVYTEAEVREFIDQFIESVRRSQTTIKPNQSAFMRFTGWWGRARARSPHRHGSGILLQALDGPRIGVLESAVHRDFPQGQRPRPWTWGKPWGTPRCHNP